MLGNESGPLRPRWLKISLAAALAASLAACGGDPAGPEQAVPTADDAAAPGDAPAAAAQQDSGDAHEGMSVEELRAAAGKAYAESRLYAPPGDNALEYYLALRERLPGDAAVSSVLTDLLPMTVIATEQSRDREDYEEARRLRVLIERASPGHPALARLSASIDEAEERSQQQIAQQELTAEQEADRQRQLQAERQRQQQEQQEEAARQAQEQAEQEESEEQEAAQRAEREREAARVAAEQRAAQQREAEAQAAARAAAPAVSDVRPISTPAPRYPPEALRAGQSGEVMVEFTVNQDGTVANARVVRADPARVFDREAVAAVRRWRFEPVAEPVTTRRTIGFNPGD